MTTLMLQTSADVSMATPPRAAITIAQKRAFVALIALSCRKVPNPTRRHDDARAMRARGFTCAVRQLLSPFAPRKHVLSRSERRLCRQLILLQCLTALAFSRPVLQRLSAVV